MLTKREWLAFIEAGFSTAKQSATANKERAKGIKSGRSLVELSLIIISKLLIQNNVRAERIELSHQAWEARRLPLHHAR